MDQADLVLEYLQERAGLSRSGLQRIGAAETITRLQRKLNATNSRDFLNLIARDKTVFDTVIGEVTVGETYFFRDRAQLDAVRRIALPGLAEIRSPTHEYRIWSAGCSTGEEAYSLAILMEQEGLAERCSILGTDISQPALSRARIGQYFPWALRGLSAPFIARYFTLNGKVATVVDRIRGRVEFQQLNLALDCYPRSENRTSDFDLILCRNVLIYFDAKTVEAVAERFYKSLAPGGWLIMGASDPPLWQYAPLNPVIVPGAVIYQRQPAGKKTCRTRSSVSSATSPAGKRPAAGELSKLKKVAVSVTSAPPTGSVKSRRLHETKPSSPPPPSDAASYEQVALMAKREGVERAEVITAAMIEEQPLSTELRYGRCLLLMSQDKDEEALAELRRMIFIDRSLAAAHFTIGSIFHKNGDLRRARRAFSNAQRLAAGRPPTELVRFGSGMTASRMAALARHRMLELSQQADTL